MPALPLPSLLPASLRSLSGRSIPVSFSLSQAHFSWLRLGYREERTGRAKGPIPLSHCLPFSPVHLLGERGNRGNGREREKG